MCDLNNASISEISSLAGVSQAQAYDLELWRPFWDWGEVAVVPGFDMPAVRRLQAEGAFLGPVAGDARG